MKVIALYLPQYHAIPENDIWWGKGYTEWDSLKRGTVLIDGQYQPRVPLHNYYYDLSDIEVMRWQVDMAREYGIYGFCVYHYWFDGKLLLHKPMENYLSSDIDFPFFFCWANENWSNIWEGDTKTFKTLITHNYSNRDDWRAHFNYWLPFFKDPRYIKENNCPLLDIYDPEICGYDTLKEMMLFWDGLAKENGFNGITYMYQASRAYASMKENKRRLFKYNIEYCPSITDVENLSSFSRMKGHLVNRISGLLRQFNKSILDRKLDAEKYKDTIKTIQDYDSQWGKILNRRPSSNTIPGAFVDWDNTPRRMRLGKVILGASPEKFKEYFKRQIERAKIVYHKNMIIVFAWNEWSEGGYLEPDEKFRYGYLEAIKEALIETNELENNNKTEIQIER